MVATTFQPLLLKSLAVERPRPLDVPVIKIVLVMKDAPACLVERRASGCGLHLQETPFFYPIVPKPLLAASRQLLRGRR
jgi:hypothetical protein